MNPCCLTALQDPVLIYKGWAEGPRFCSTNHGVCEGDPLALVASIPVVGLADLSEDPLFRDFVAMNPSYTIHRRPVHLSCVLSKPLLDFLHEIFTWKVIKVKPFFRDTPTIGSNCHYHYYFAIHQVIYFSVVWTLYKETYITKHRIYIQLYIGTPVLASFWTKNQ